VYALVLHSMQKPRASNGGDLAQPADSTEGYNQVAPFALTERSGRTITRNELLGKPWIASFVFTRCTGPCPRISSNMKKMQDRLAGESVRLVTFSVDPEYDTPEVLAKYADALGADPERWWFLTGTTDAIQAISRKSFMLPIERDASRPVGQSVTHRTVLTVVDKNCRVRGYYDGESDAGIDQALARAKYLAHETSKP
jgi:cytochrome oxidase Cu insertion factor (SCO1/SenC/PrrC family)